jgi:2-oxoglutarate dehydrogenase E1 component
MMNQLFGNSLLFGGNAPFVEELYENYLDNPGSVSEQWREYFDKLAQLPGHVARDVPHSAGHQCLRRTGEERRLSRGCGGTGIDDKKQVGILQMITAYRFIGRSLGQPRPAQAYTAPGCCRSLDPAHYGLSDADLNTMFNAVGSFKGDAGTHATFGQILRRLESDLLRLDRRRVHVSEHACREALAAGSPRTYPLQAQLTPLASGCACSSA